MGGMVSGAVCGMLHEGIETTFLDQPSSCIGSEIRAALAGWRIDQHKQFAKYCLSSGLDSDGMANAGH